MMWYIRCCTRYKQRQWNGRLNLILWFTLLGRSYYQIEYHPHRSLDGCSLPRASLLFLSCLLHLFIPQSPAHLSQKLSATILWDYIFVTLGQGLDLSRSPRSWNDRFTFRPSPSPPAAYISMSAPMGFFGSASTDEGIEEDTMYPMDDLISSKRQKVCCGCSLWYKYISAVVLNKSLSKGLNQNNVPKM